MRICLLTDQELDADPFPEDDWPCDPRPFMPEAEWELLTLWKEYAVAQLVEASHKDFDVFFNLCDGAWDEGRVGVEVVQTLEWLNLPFTGATPEFFEPSREAMKRVCRAWDIDTPAYVLAKTERDFVRVLDRLDFPLFVKHPNSYASNGLTRESKVTTESELREQAGLMIRRFGSVLIEEFVEGVECTVLVAENPDDATRPTTYQPIQYRFPEGETFKHYDLKWVDYDGLEAFPVSDPELDARLREVSARFFVGMRGAGFGRCDIRVDARGRAFMLEINPNCGVYYPPSDPGSADLCLAHDPAGHEGFTRQLVAAGIRRHGRRQRSWEVLPRREDDYGVYATRAVPQGERLMVFEETPHHLVTSTHVEASWDERRRDWFARYAWPLTDEVWVTWSEDPEEWRPINHSCDPSAWLEGLDVVARRPLKRGDEITLDYGTFYDERMPSFECTCGAGECRGTIRGDDYRLDIVARYGTHVSDHIRRKRAALYPAAPLLP
jgi:D-alanine-D-alanine ligase-like ATP-grasp enzyme